MILQFQHKSKTFEFDAQEGIDLSIPIQFSKENLSAFGVGQPTKNAYRVEGFTGDVSQGGSCNCDVVQFIPHCHGTHTECVGHILDTPVYLPNIIKQDLFISQVVTVKPESNFGITAKILDKTKRFENVSALIIRTLPNDPTKKNQKYSSEAPYLTKNAVEWINDKNISHLLVDFPSIDPIQDGGKLEAHRTFWNLPLEQKKIDEQTWSHKTVTELIYVPSSIEDGLYILDLRTSNFMLDAVPSSPVIFPVRSK